VATTHFFPSPVARRYGGALFELAQQQNCIDAVEKLLRDFIALVEASDDLRRLVRSPLFAAQSQLAAMTALIKKAQLAPKGASGLVANFLKSVALHRRLSHLADMVEVFGELRRQARGEMVAYITCAHALNAAQCSQLKQQLDDLTGKNVALKINVNPDILGGLVVQLGSRQLDTSLKTKLSSLKMHLKEVG